MAALRALYASGSLRRLQREGVVLVGLAAAEAGRLYRSTLWRFGLPPRSGAGGGGGGGGGGSLPYHKFRPGASVIVTRHTPEEGGGGGGGGGRGGSKGAAGGASAAGSRGGAEAVAVAVDAESGVPSEGVEGVVVEVRRGGVGA